MKQIYSPCLLFTDQWMLLWSRGSNICYSSNHRDQPALTWQKMPHPSGLPQGLFPLGSFPWTLPPSHPRLELVYPSDALFWFLFRYLSPLPWASYSESSLMNIWMNDYLLSLRFFLFFYNRIWSFTREIYKMLLLLLFFRY